ncbi:MAG: hypothetical protein F4X02_16375 [Chloroflexi bacterium]|nr:hypothetical protein [Chloroflexota bacterium]
MDQTQIPTYLALAMNAIVVLLMVASFFRRYATKDDIKDLNDRLAGVEARLGNVEAGQAALESRQAALENQFIDVNRNVREIGKKVDASLDLHNAVRTDLGVLQAAVNRLDSYFETPKLKSS